MVELLCDQILISSLSQKNPLIFRINANYLKPWIIALLPKIQLLLNSDELKTEIVILLFIFWQTEDDWEEKCENKNTFNKAKCCIMRL